MPHSPLEKPRTFAEVRQALRAALCMALEEQAKHQGLAQDPALFSRAADELDAWIGSAHSADEDPCHEALLSHFHGVPPLALVAFETPSIQPYLFKTRRPLDLLGGSRLIDDFSVEAIPKLFGDRLIYSGAGTGLWLGPAFAADAICRQIVDTLRSESRNELVPTTARLDVWPRDLGGDRPPLPTALEFLNIGDENDPSPPEAPSRYAATFSTLLARLRRARGERPLPVPLEAAALGERCQACGERHGTLLDATREGERICPVCSARRQVGRKARKRSDEKNSFEDLFEGLEGPRDLAVLYADGANAGDLFQRIDTPARHCAVSLAIDGALKAAHAAALDVVSDGEQRAITPIRGGDDLLMIFPARYAFEVVPTLLRAFEEAIDQRLRDDEAFNGHCPSRLKKAFERFGLGIGLAIADVHFPVFFLLRYATELLKSAKRRTAEGERSAFDFAILRSGTPLSDSVAALRRAEIRETADERLEHTFRPYGGSELADFLERARALAALVPPSQVYALQQEMRRGRARSRSLWRYQQARSKGWGQYRERLQLDLAKIDQELWRRADTADSTGASKAHFRSQYPDLIDVYPFFRGDAMEADEDDRVGTSAEEEA